MRGAPPSSSSDPPRVPADAELQRTTARQGRLHPPGERWSLNLFRLGWRVLEDVVAEDVREEMDAIKNPEMLIPILHAPPSCRSGWLGVRELFKLNDGTIKSSP